MGYERKDTWYQKAKAEGYRSRAAYKLQELDKAYRLFRRNQTVLDLGCAPGGWLQVAAEKVGPSGRVVGIDRLEVPPLGLTQVVVLQCDLYADDTPTRVREALGQSPEIVLSDMAPDTSGVGFADQARSADLVQNALRLARTLLAPGGSFVAKIFEGPDVNAIVTDLRAAFSEVKRTRLDTTRKGSKELYLIAKGFKP